MAGVQLDAVEAGAPGALGGVGEGGDEVGDVLLRHLVIGHLGAGLREVRDEALQLVGGQVVRQVPDLGGQD